jgi:hypothetical protein
MALSADRFLSLRRRRDEEARRFYEIAAGSLANA